MARIEAHLAHMQNRLKQQDETIRAQQAIIAEQRATIEKATARTDAIEARVAQPEPERADGSAWYERVAISGVVEVEAGTTSPYTGDRESDLTLATFELAVAAKITDLVSAGGSLLYEEGDTPLEVDTAWVTLGNSEEGPWSVTAGQIYVPFGVYETKLLSDPLTLELGETRETAVQGGTVSGPFNAALYLFNGDNEHNGRNRIASWGVSGGFSQGDDDVGYSLGLGYISDLGDSDSLQGVIADYLGSNDTDRVGAWTASAAAQFGAFTVIGEYLTASESFEAAAVPWKAGGARPSAWNIEAGYGFELMGREATVAVGYQGTREALALELPRQRLLTAVSVGVYDGTTLSFEWAHDTDYDTGDGGTGESANTLTAQLAVEF